MTTPSDPRNPSRRRWLAAMAAGVALGLTATGSPGLAAEDTASTSLSAERARGNPKAYKFVDKINGEPVHWDPCRRIGWGVNPKKSPKRAVPHAKEAMQRVKQATGLRFKYQGRTDANPKKFGTYPKDTNLVMGWGRPKATGGAAGLGGPQWLSNGRIINGFVVLNYRYNDKIAPGFGRGPKSGYQGTLGQLMMHELGHAMGLDHVGDKRQIMYGTMTRKKATWGAGDQNGLRKVGKAAGCF